MPQREVKHVVSTVARGSVGITGMAHAADAGGSNYFHSA